MLRTETQELCYNTLTRNKSHTQKIQHRDLVYKFRPWKNPQRGKPVIEGRILLFREMRYIYSSHIH
jgi:hypothetical protein